MGPTESWLQFHLCHILYARFLHSFPFLILPACAISQGFRSQSPPFSSLFPVHFHPSPRFRSGFTPFFFFFFLFSHWFATPIPACFDSLNFFLFFFLQFIHLSLHFSPLFSWLTPHLLPSVLPLFLLVPFPFPTCPHFVPLLMKLKGRLLLDGKRGQVLVPVPLDKGNAGSGNKIDSYWEPHIPARMREERKMVPADNTPKSF